MSWGGNKDEPVDSYLLVLDIVSVKFVLGIHVKGNVAELQCETGWVGGALLPAPQ